MPTPFDNGEFWNCDAENAHITRLRFAQRNDCHYVSAWGACYPRDCEWGGTVLSVAADGIGRAFASWNLETGVTHCLFDANSGALKVTIISPECLSITDHVFQKDAERSAETLNPLVKLRHMWDGSQPGWKLIQYDSPVYLIEFEFDESGPSRQQIPVLVEFHGPFDWQSEAEIYERLRVCTGLGIAEPLNASQLERLEQLQEQLNFDVNIETIAPNDYLVLAPDGRHHNWSTSPNFRRRVIRMMLAARCPILNGRLD